MSSQVPEGVNSRPIEGGACRLQPPTTRLTELPHPLPSLVGPALPDLGDCSVVSIVCGLRPGERAGMCATDWPLAVSRAMEQELAGWLGRNPARVVRLVSTYSTGGECGLILHHAAQPP